MTPTTGTSLLQHFSALKDPRQSWKVLYPLPEVLLLVLCATLAGGACPAAREAGPEGRLRRDRGVGR